MSALNWYSGKATWGDQPPCVCPMIRPLAIALNDMLADGERERIIGPHLFAPLGTATNDDAIVDRRMWMAVDRAVRVFAPLALDAAGLGCEATRLRALPEVKRENAAAAAAAYAARAAQAAYAAHAVDAHATHATHAAQAAAYAAAAATHAAHAAHAVDAVLLQLILDMCAVGTHEEPDATRAAETIEMLCSSSNVKE